MQQDKIWVMKKRDWEAQSRIGVGPESKVGKFLGEFCCMVHLSIAVTRLSCHWMICSYWKVSYNSFTWSWCLRHQKRQTEKRLQFVWWKITLSIKFLLEYASIKVLYVEAIAGTFRVCIRSSILWAFSKSPSPEYPFISIFRARASGFIPEFTIVSKMLSASCTLPYREQAMIPANKWPFRTETLWSFAFYEI